ncbi:MAG: exodeoxyribonuclease VII large subunit [Chloroflexota bacterium]
MQQKTVTEITRHIKALIDGDDGLADVWVVGEISNFSRAASGHCYFTLKDSNAVLACVMWRNVAAALRWAPAPGDLAEAFGSVSVYERGGNYQFYVSALQRGGGVGALWQAFEALKARLEAEGLFAPERKRPLPAWPRRIGVVTSPTGAALRDILNVLERRYPLVEVVLAPSLVQGAEAPAGLVQALQALNREPGIDVIIVARGGGSIEDLWAFNDEAVARAIAASRAPVVSGVGHETDFTIADFVADVRMPTPTAAAVAVVPDGAELRVRLIEQMQALTERVTGRLAQARVALEQHERLLALHSPGRRVLQERQHIDDVTRRGREAVARRIGWWRQSVQNQAACLRALNPRRVLARGYAIVQERATGAYVQSVRAAAPGQDWRVYLADGHADARVIAVHDRSDG